jgi:hypothetical protein
MVNTEGIPDGHLPSLNHRVLRGNELAMNLRILFTICVVALIYGVGATDAQAVSLVELVATNGTVTADNVWFGHFTASISAQGNVSPTTLDQVTVLGGVPSIRFVGPFTARSPSVVYQGKSSDSVPISASEPSSPPRNSCEWGWRICPWEHWSAPGASPIFDGSHCGSLFWLVVKGTAV